MVWNPSITRTIGANAFPNGITTTSCTCPGPFYTSSPVINYFTDDEFGGSSDVGHTCCGGYETGNY